MSKTIRMQYPNDTTGTNPAYDGQIHNIQPTSIRKLPIAGNFYVMEYFDENIQSNFVTVITSMNGTLYKVPLDDYDELFRYLDNVNLAYEDIENFDFPDMIGLIQQYRTKDLLGGVYSDTGAPQQNQQVAAQAVATSSKQTPIALTQSLVPDPPGKNRYVELDFYIPLRSEWTGNIKSGIFRSCDIIVDPNSGNQKYEYRKSENYQIIDDAIQNVISNLPKADDSLQERTIFVDVPEGTIGYEYAFDNNNNGYVKTVNVIPGKYTIHLYFTQLVDDNDYVASRMASEYNVFANSGEYRDLHDYPKAFNDGCKRILSTEFKNSTGKVIASNTVDTVKHNL